MTEPTRKVVWLTGLPASGKSTLGRALVADLLSRGQGAMLLDGDELREGLNSDLSFTREARAEVCRRIGWMAHTISDQGLFFPRGVVPVVAAVTPYRSDRYKVRRTFEEGAFIEVHVYAPLAVCKARDSRGLYAKAERGELTNLTGVDDPYEEPGNPTLILDTTTQSVALCVKILRAAVLGD